MSDLSDDMIVLLNKRNEAAFEVVFNIYYPRLVAFASQYVSRDDALNQVQDAFISILEKDLVFSFEGQLKSYLYTTVKNNCLMFLRHENVKMKYLEKKNAPISQINLNVQALESLDTSAMTFSEIEQIIKATLEKLPPKCREVFVFSRFDGKRNTEVAELLNISEKCVEAHITKALKIFRVALNDYLAILIFLF